MSETRDFVREEGKEKNSIIIVLLQAHTHIHAGETRFLSPLLYIYTYICVYVYIYMYIYACVCAVAYTNLENQRLEREKEGGGRWW